MGEAERGDAGWPVTWEASRKEQLRRWRHATPAERLAWLEEALEIAARSGALARERARRADEAP